MSRIGKQIIQIPAKTEVSYSGDLFKVKGPKGELTRSFNKSISITIADNTIALAPVKQDLESMALWGTYASHIGNMIEGVNNMFTKKLIIEGIGYKAEAQGQKLTLNLGFSHPVFVEVPEDLKVTVEKGVMTITGVNKESVGQFAGMIRSMKKPEPYKGKGIRYEKEVIKRKQGKKSV